MNYITSFTTHNFLLIDLETALENYFKTMQLLVESYNRVEMDGEINHEGLSYKKQSLILFK